MTTENIQCNIDLTCFNWVKMVTKSDLNYHSKYLALYLSTFMNSNQDMAFPSLARIKVETGLGHATMLKYLKVLEAEGWMIKKSGNRTTNNQYTITIPRPAIEEAMGRSRDDVGRDSGYVGSEEEVGREPTTNNNIITKEVLGTDVDFDKFWQIYPRKVGKESARKAWAKIKCTDALFDKIYENIKARCESGEWTRERMTYVPHPATYLNGQRWEDELEPPQAQRQIPQSQVGTTRGRTIEEDLSDTSWAN